MKKLALTFLVFFTVLVSSLYAGSIDTSGFTNPSIYTYDGLGLPFNNPTPITLGGNVYTTDDAFMRYTDFGAGLCVSGECIGDNTDTGYIDIVLGTAFQRVGGWVGASAGYVEFFDTSDKSLGQVLVSPFQVLPDGSSIVAMAFAGWDAGAGLIARIRIYDTETNGSIVTFDDLYTEGGSAAVPEPATMLLFGAGIAGLAGFSRRQRS